MLNLLIISVQLVHRALRELLLSLAAGIYRLMGGIPSRAPYTFPGNFEGKEWELDPLVYAEGNTLIGNGWATLTLDNLNPYTVYQVNLQGTLGSYLGDDLPDDDAIFYVGIDGEPVARIVCDQGPYPISVENNCIGLRKKLRIYVKPWCYVHITDLVVEPTDEKPKDTHKYTLKNNVKASNLNLDGSDCAETIKGSNLSNSGVVEFDIIAGYEDGIDCVRGSNYLFKEGSIRASDFTRTFITLKGGIKGYTLRNLELDGEPSLPWDISIGDHTIYNKGELLNMEDGLISGVYHASGRKVRIFVLDGEVPVCEFGKYKVIKVPRFVAKLWMKLLK
jgi:hypothetical protein